MKKIFLQIFRTGGVLYISTCIFLYFSQEKLIFFPEKLDKNYQFEFKQKFEEINITATDTTNLHGLLFKTDNPKGLIFYLHGNAGSIRSWGEIAKTYTDLKYDIFIGDYRGFGKSEGEIKSQERLYQDNQTMYDELKKKYTEESIIIIWYSIGTGPAAKLASTNSPKLVILQAPYYNMTDLMQDNYPFIPTFLLKYKFATNEYLERCWMPVVLFHGDSDDVIKLWSSLKLQKKFKSEDTLIVLKGQGHNGITENQDYVRELRKILAK